MTADGGVDAEELGRATWTFLHTLAASQPQELDDGEQRRLRRFITDFSQIYPCAPCASSFREHLKERPPVVTSGPLFAQWMCAVHNDVNRELGKEAYDCSRVGERWGVCEQCARHEDELAEFKRLTMKMKPVLGRKNVEKEKEK